VHTSRALDMRNYLRRDPRSGMPQSRPEFYSLFKELERRDRHDGILRELSDDCSGPNVPPCLCRLPIHFRPTEIPPHLLNKELLQLPGAVFENLPHIMSNEQAIHQPATRCGIAHKIPRPADAFAFCKCVLVDPHSLPKLSGSISFDAPFPTRGDYG
jgi:hypothetical protein